jgi:ketosteroid isomerase-like protein
MKCCTGNYTIKSFYLVWSDYYQTWDVEANFLIKEYGDDNIVIDFICNNRIEGKKTIKQTKEYIKELIENGIVEKLKTELEKELKEG